MRKATNYLIGAFVFLSSTFYIPGQNFHDSQRILFQIAGMLFFAMMLCWKPIRQLRNVWLSGFLIYAIIVFLIHDSIRVMSIAPLINIFLMVALYYVFSNYLENDDVIYKAIQGIIVVNLVFLAFQFLKIDPLMLNDRRLPNTHLVGLFGHPMNMGIFCSIVLPYVLHKSKTWAVLAGVCLLASMSYISIALGVFGLLLYLFFTNKIAFKIALAITLVIGLILVGCIAFLYDDVMKNTVIRKFTLRYQTNYPFLKTALSNPHRGYGLGSFAQVSRQVMKKEGLEQIGLVDVTWNDYLGCAIEMGIWVWFIFFGLFRQTILRFRNSLKPHEITALFCSLSTIPIGIMIHSYMNYINVGVICVALFSAFEIKLAKEEIC